MTRGAGHRPGAPWEWPRCGCPLWWSGVLTWAVHSVDHTIRFDNTTNVRPPASASTPSSPRSGRELAV